MAMIWYIAAGSALGGVARYLAGGYAHSLAGDAFPIGTLLVNVSGSFLVGLLLRLSLATPSISPEIRAFLTVGFCGGFTTFSTFSFDTTRLLADGAWGRASANIVLSVALSLGAVCAGFVVARQLVALRGP